MEYLKEVSDAKLRFQTHGYSSFFRKTQVIPYKR